MPIQTHCAADRSFHRTLLLARSASTQPAAGRPRFINIAGSAALLAVGSALSKEQKMPLLADSLRNLTASLIVIALTVGALYVGSSIFIPLAIAIVIAFILAPLVRWLAARHVPQPVAAVGVLAAAILLLVALSFAVSTQLLSLTAELGGYKHNLVEKVRTVAEMGRSDGLIKRAVTAVETLGADIERELGRGVAAKPDPLVVAQQQGTPAEILLGIGAALEPLAQVGITILFAMLLLLQHHDIRDRIVRIAGTDRLSGTAAAISDAGSKLSELFLALATMNAGYGFIIGVSLWLIGVPNPLLWGILAALLRFVPFAGPLLAAIPPIVLAAAVDPGWMTLILTIALFIIGETIFNNIVEPFMLGRKAGITAFGMAVAASFWTVVWGPIGLLLSAPLTTTIVVFGHHVRGLEFISVLFGDEPALDPAQELYHRLLAGDPVAAASTLEEEAEELSPVETSDRLVLAALRLAAMDHRSQRLDAEQAEELRGTMEETADLYFDAPDDAAKKVDGQEPPSVCVIPARGMIDRAAADHIARLVSLHTPCRAVVATRSTGLTAIADLRTMEEFQDVDTIVIATVGGVDEKQLRLIARRAVRDFPDAHHFVLAPPRQGPAPATETDQRKEDGASRIHTSIAPIVAALDCAPRRPRDKADAAASAGVSRPVETIA
jgi:predicted PurR-regulated permease PerM